MAKLSVRAASLRCEPSEVLRRMLFKGENLVSYLKLFSEQRRAAVYSLLRDRPLLDDVIHTLGGFPGLMELDECVNLRVVGKVCYITEQRGFDEYEPFGFFKAYRDMEFATEGLRVALPEVVPEFPDGYCYLKGVDAALLGHVATMFGPHAAVADVAPFVRADLPVLVAAGAAHVVEQSSHETVPVAALEPTVLVGGTFCANVDPPVAEPAELCDACKLTQPAHKQLRCVDLVCADPGIAQVKDPTPLEQRYSVLKSRTSAQADVLLACDPPTVDLEPFSDGDVGTCHLRPSHQSVPCDSDVFSYAVVHRCVPGAQTVRMSAAYWAVEVQRGEVLSNAAVVFRPDARDGGVVVGRGQMEFVYHGQRSLLVVRRFDQSAYTRFMHARLAYGHASRLKAVARQVNASYLYQPSDTQQLDPESVRLRRFVTASSTVETVNPATVGDVSRVLVGRWGTAVRMAQGFVDAGKLQLRQLRTVVVSTPRLASRTVGLFGERRSRDEPSFSVSVFDDVDWGADESDGGGSYLSSGASNGGVG